MLTLNQAANILKQDQLLREIVIGDDWRFEVPANLKDRRLNSYLMIRAVLQPDTLFMCKGLNFNEKYLEDAIDKGAVACVTENVYAGKDQIKSCSWWSMTSKGNGSVGARVLQQPAQRELKGDRLYRDQGKNDFGILCPPI
jgi:UDP-N-acetylmuramoyl-L-alanyl-D-glutamate--2,6-diaminopimelate ligase